MIETRLGAGIGNDPGKNDDLAVGGDSHTEAILSDPAQALTARCRADLALETHPLAFELNLFRVECGQRLGLLDADRPSPHDGESDEQKTREQQSDEIATAHIRPRGARREDGRSAILN